MRLLQSCALLLVASTLTAKADTIVAFVVSGSGTVLDYPSYPSGANPITLAPGTAKGGFNFDFTTNSVISSNVTLSNGAFSTTLNLLTLTAKPPSLACANSPYYCETGSLTTTGGSFSLMDASDFGGSPFGRISQDYSGRITPLSNIVPEPSSLALLGTGLLGAVGVLRRKLTA